MNSNWIYGRALLPPQSLTSGPGSSVGTHTIAHPHHFVNLSVDRLLKV